MRSKVVGPAPAPSASGGSVYPDSVIVSERIDVLGAASYVVPAIEIIDARIERIKGHCIEIPKGAPSDAEFFPCFGFPG